MSGKSRKTSRARVGSKRGAAKAKNRPRRATKSGASLLTAMREHVRAHGENYLRDPNITSVGVGYKRAGGVRTETLSIQFTVAEKVQPEALGGLDTELIPPTITLHNGQAVPTDVIERSFEPSYLAIEPEAKSPRKARQETVRPGVSVGIVHNRTGTIGTFARETRTGRVVVLSNWHVLHGPKGALGDAIVQPGPGDDNQVERNRIGELLRSHLGAAGDCAIASMESRTFDNRQFEVDNAVGQLGAAELGDRVVKSGRTTGVTRGIVTRLDVLTKIQYSAAVSASVSGFEIGPDEKHPAAENEISKPGDSGAAWMAVDTNGNPTDVMLGLHFADESSNASAEVALACNAGTVFKKLEIEPLPATVRAGRAASEAEDDVLLQTGFDQQFLRFKVPTPGFTATIRDDLAQLDGESELRYCHFSVWLSRSRSLTRCVAWNIDGSRMKKTKRVSFRVDRRGDLASCQLDNDIYVNNPLDRGHIARRADLSWGDTLEEARKANYDSFYYTNIAPQHERFNQSEQFNGKWGMLENAIFDSVQVGGVRASLIAGPVLRATDRLYSNGERTVSLPEEFFKIVAYTDLADDTDKVKAFKLSQAKLLKTMLAPQTLELDDWIWAQVPLQQIESDTGLRFSRAFRALEVPFVASEALVDGNVRLVLAEEDFFK